MRAWEGVSWKKAMVFFRVLGHVMERELGERMRMRRTGEGAEGKPGRRGGSGLWGLELEGRHGRIVVKVRFAVVPLFFFFCFYSLLLFAGTDN